MGKRSNFERREANFYPTPRAAVVPLIPTCTASERLPSRVLAMARSSATWKRSACAVFMPATSDLVRGSLRRCRQRAHRKGLSVTSIVTTAPLDSSELFRYVRHVDVPRYTAEGWELLPALDGTHHGEYSVLTRRRV